MKNSLFILLAGALSFIPRSDAWASTARISRSCEQQAESIKVTSVLRIYPQRGEAIDREPVIRLCALQKDGTYLCPTENPKECTADTFCTEISVVLHDGKAVLQIKDLITKQIMEETDCPMK